MNPDQIDSSLDHLFPAFREKVVLVLAQVNHETAGKYPGLSHVGIFEGYRSTARQEWLYEQSRTRPGKRVTNDKVPRKHGWGLACDIVGFTASGEPSWDWPDAFWQQLGHAARTQGLEWGGDWPGTLQDTDHVQATAAYKAEHLHEVVSFLRAAGLTVPAA